MNIRKAFVFFGAVLILGTGLLLAQGTKTSGQNRFVDQNGDGICDRMRDHDGDGIPNGQDPDWVKPEDGTGYQDRYGQGGERGHHGTMAANAFLNKARLWNKNSFRAQRGLLGKGTCSCARQRVQRASR